MKRGKIMWSRIAILIGGLMVLCVAGCLILNSVGRPALRAIRSQFWNTDLAYAAQIAHEMIDYDLPPGYQEQKAMTIQDARVVIIAHRERPDDNMVIELELETINVEEPEYREQIEEMRAREVGDHDYSTQRVSTQDVIIRGQPVTLSIREGQDDRGRPARQVIGSFAGKNGDVVMVIAGVLDTWDQKLVDDFIQSIR